MGYFYAQGKCKFLAKHPPTAPLVVESVTIILSIGEVFAKNKYINKMQNSPVAAIISAEPVSGGVPMPCRACT